jgi:hypothetical protein
MWHQTPQPGDQKYVLKNQTGLAWVITQCARYGTGQLTSDFPIPNM